MKTTLEKTKWGTYFQTILKFLQCEGPHVHEYHEAEIKGAKSLFQSHLHKETEA